MAWKIEGLLETLGIRREKTIGIAFSGGGARGFAHVGVIKAFEKFGIVPDIMAGVSAGSIASALYGAGLTPDDIIKCFTDASRFADFTEWSIPRQGFLRLNRFAKLLEEWLPIRNLEEMRIPTVICATDFDAGKSIGWCKGEIIPRVIASCSIPIVFPPVKIKGTNYVDGGVLRNLPAWAIRDYCTTLYGSNCSPMTKGYKQNGSILDVAYRTFRLVMKSNTPQDLRLCDHIIQIDQISKVSTFELKSLRKGVEAGYEAACRMLEHTLKE